MVAGVILAGGLARRMGGGDKALLELAGRPLLAHVIERLAPQVDELVLNANGDPARFAQFGLPVVPDTVEGFAGPLAGVLAGMRWAAARGHQDVASAAGDTPFFPTDLVARLQAARGDQPICMAATRDPERGLSEHPTFALWPVRLADDLEKSLTEEHHAQGHRLDLAAWLRAGRLRGRRVPLLQRQHAGRSGRGRADRRGRARTPGAAVRAAGGQP